MTEPFDREYWLETHAKTVVKIAMSAPISHSEIQEALDRVSPDLCQLNRIDAAGVAYKEAMNTAAKALVLVEHLHRIWIEVENL